MSPPAKSILDDLPPGLNFGPDDEQIIELYLLPRVRGQPDLIPALIIDDDAAANTQPWNLFRRHGLSDKFPAFFFVRNIDARPGARPIRVCPGGGAWKSQRRHSEDEGHELILENGEKIKWERHNLNFNMGSGSVGWVMREYSVPACPSHRLCRISLSGHGQKRMRSSDEYDDSMAAGEPVPRRVRVAEYQSDSSSISASWTTPASFDQGLDTPQACQDQEPSAFQDQVQTTMEQLSASSMVPTPNQNNLAIPDPLDILSAEEMAEMYNCFAELPALGEPYQQQQFDSQDLEQPCSASLMALTPNQDPAHDCAVSDPFDILSVEEMTDMYNCFGALPNNGPFDEQVPMVQNKVDQEAAMPSFCGAQDMDGLFTATEDSVEWEGMLFC